MSFEDVGCDYKPHDQSWDELEARSSNTKSTTIAPILQKISKIYEKAT
jgi:hypothetical protein